MKGFKKFFKQDKESKQKKFEKFYKLLSKQTIRVKSKEKLLENNCKREFYIFSDVFRKSKTFYKSIHSLSSFSSLFCIFKTIFQVQVRRTLEQIRILLTFVQVL